jgi:transposase InsO family protein
VAAVLESLTSLHPATAFIRSDNGPEFIAHALSRWARSSATTGAYIEPGSQWQNDFAESINARIRDSSSTPSCSPRWLRLRPWLVAGAGSTTPSVRIRAPRGVRS